MRLICVFSDLIRAHSISSRFCFRFFLLCWRNIIKNNNLSVVISQETGAILSPLLLLLQLKAKKGKKKIIWHHWPRRENYWRLPQPTAIHMLMTTDHHYHEVMSFARFERALGMKLNFGLVFHWVWRRRVLNWRLTSLERLPLIRIMIKCGN